MELGTLEEAIERYTEKLKTLVPGSEEAKKVTEQLEVLYKLRNEQYKLEADAYSKAEEVRVQEERLSKELDIRVREADLKEAEITQRRKADRSETIRTVLGICADVAVTTCTTLLSAALVLHTQEFELDNVWTGMAKTLIPPLKNFLKR